MKQKTSSQISSSSQDALPKYLHVDLTSGTSTKHSYNLQQV